MKVTRAFLADGNAITTEAGKGRCWDSEEVYCIEVEGEEGAVCDICGEPIVEQEEGL